MKVKTKKQRSDTKNQAGATNDSFLNKALKSVRIKRTGADRSSSNAPTIKRIKLASVRRRPKMSKRRRRTTVFQIKNKAKSIFPGIVCTVFPHKINLV